MNKLLFRFLFALLSFTSFQARACDVDVTIQQGDTIEMCVSSILPINASLGFVGYVWSGAGTSSTNEITPTTGGWYFVDAMDGVACVSTDSIFVIILSDPIATIQSSEGTNLCPGSSGTVLSLTAPYQVYDWSTGEGNPSILVTTGGTYSVDVVDANNCMASASLTINVPDFEVEIIGNSTICAYSTVGIQASGGDAYAWSTGEFSDFIVVNPSIPTTYSVTIFQGSCVQTLSTTLDVVASESYELNDTVYYKPSDSKGIQGPSGYTDYEWLPENLVNNYNSGSVTYLGTESGWVSFTAVSPSGCTVSDSVYVYILDLFIPQGFSPNDDTYNDFFVVDELETLQANVLFWNRWGDPVYTSENYQNDWDGTCQSTLCLGNEDLPEGTYFYLIDVKGVKFEGYITLKR